MRGVDRLADQLRLALPLVARAQRVVEDDDAPRTGDALDERCHLRVINALQRIGIEKVEHRRALLDQHEAVLLQREILRLAAIRYLDAVRLLGAAPAAPDVVRPKGLVDQLFAGVPRLDDFGQHGAILECPEPMRRRRDFLRIAALGAAWPALGWGQPKKPEGISVNDVQGQLSGTLVYRIVQPDTLEGVQAALKLAQSEERALCISGGRHSMGSQAFAAEGVLVDTRKLAKVLALDGERGLIEVEAGMEWPELLATLHPTPWAFNQKQSGVDRVTVGGSLSANIHGRGLASAPFISDIESFKLVNARGQLVDCSRTENAELFRLAIGGYGLFGFVYSVTLRLVRRRKVERVTEMRTIDGLSAAFADRIRDGFLDGEFRLSTNETSPDFLRRGVFICHRAAGDERPMPPAPGELGAADWNQLFYLEHTDKTGAFKRIADFYIATSGQLYWSDDVQMSQYPEGYHPEIHRRGAGRGSHALTH